MPKNWWFKFEWKDWRDDPQLRRCSLEAQGFWINCLCVMHASDAAELSGTADELARLIGCFSEELMRCVIELKRTNTADVTIGNGDVTVRSRRREKELKAKELSTLRVQRHRQSDVCNAEVTLQSKSKSKKEDKNKKEEREKEAATPPHSLVLEQSPFDHPAVIQYQDKMQVKARRNFAKALADRVNDLDVWVRLLDDKIAWADKPLDKRENVANWILIEYDKRIQEKTNGRPISEREKSAQRGTNAVSLIDELRRQGIAEEQALSGGINGFDPSNTILIESTEPY